MLDCILKINHTSKETLSYLLYNFSIMHFLDYYKHNEKRVVQFNDYFQKQFNTKTNMLDLIKKIFGCVECSNLENGLYKVSLNENIKINHLKVASLIHLIDSGNLEIRGLNIIENSFNSAKLNILRLL